MELVAIERTVANLRAEGRVVTDVWYPDRDGDTLGLVGRRPDAAMMVDGQAAALDVTWFLPELHGWAAAQLDTWGRKLEARLAAADLPGTLFVLVEYDPARLPRRRTMAAMDAWLEPMSTVLLRRAPHIGGDVRQRLGARFRPPWAKKVRAVRLLEGRSAVSVVRIAELTSRDVAGVLEKIRRDKGAQLAAWHLGILVLVGAAIHESPYEVVAALRARGDWPFWRVYWLDQGGVRLIWEAQEGDR